MSELDASLDAPKSSAPLPAAPAAQATPPEAEHHAWIEHLGLPFYYRHTPGAAMRRGVFWAVFLIGIAVLLFNMMEMPFHRGTLMRSIHDTLIGGRPGYASFDQAARGLFAQCTGVAMVLSCILAPLLATYSLASERVAGTLEFLRLTPMSTTAIVMGKMFAPGWVLHAISGALLLLAMPLGLLGGYKLVDLCFACIAIPLSCAMFHALGAFLASLTTAFRGFASVGALLFVGGYALLLPVAAIGEKEVSFLAPLSPWGTLDLYFWQEFHWSARYQASQFAGSETLAKLYALVAIVILLVLLVRAASRKLEDSFHTAVPKLGWLALWLLIVATVGGMILNNFALGRNPKGSWEDAAAVLFCLGVMLCFLILFDHPHRREKALTNECERIAGREAPPSIWQRLGHATFLTLMTVLFLSNGMLCFYLAGELEQLPDSVFLLIVLGPAILAFFGAMIVETAAVRYFAFAGQAALAAGGIALLLAALLVPIGHVGAEYGRWERASYAAEREFRNINSFQQNYYGWFDTAQSMRNLPEFAEYFKEMNTLSQVMQTRERYEKAPLALFVRYHPLATLVYALIWLAAGGAVVWLRRRTYRAITREAEEAVLPR